MHQLASQYSTEERGPGGAADFYGGGYGGGYGHEGQQQTYVPPQSSYGGQQGPESDEDRGLKTKLALGAGGIVAMGLIKHMMDKKDHQHHGHHGHHGQHGGGGFGGGAGGLGGIGASLLGNKVGCEMYCSIRTAVLTMRDSLVVAVAAVVSHRSSEAEAVVVGNGDLLLGPLLNNTMAMAITTTITATAITVVDGKAIIIVSRRCWRCPARYTHVNKGGAQHFVSRVHCRFSLHVQRHAPSIGDRAILSAGDGRVGDLLVQGSHDQTIGFVRVDLPRDRHQLDSPVHLVRHRSGQWLPLLSLHPRPLWRRREKVSR
jgi:hypothetical protein